MDNYLTIFINEQSVFEYDREQPLEDRQLEFLDRMDSDMDRGLKIKGQLIENPGPEHRLQFMAMNLIKALQQDDDAKIAVSCAYLTNRRPELKEVHARDGDNSVVIEFIDETLQ